MILDFLNLGHFWRKQELANQGVHIVVGIFCGFALLYLGFGVWSVIGGLSGLLELLRQLWMEDPELDRDFLYDKIRDNIFYWIGAALPLIVWRFPL